MATKEELQLMDQYNRDRLIKSNDNIRNQIAAGLPARTIAERMSPENPDQGMQILAAMSLSETHDMPLGQSMAVTPGVLTNAFGENFNIDDVVKELYGTTAKFDISTKALTREEARVTVAEEEIVSETQSYDLAVNRAELQIDYSKNLGEVNTLAVAMQRSQANDEQAFGWSAQDPGKEQFYKGMIDAETEVQRDQLRKDRFVSLLAREGKRLNEVELWQDRLEAAALNPPSYWESKKRAWSQGSAFVGQATLDATSDLVRMAGFVSRKQSMTETADGIADWARAYHKAVQLPDLQFNSINTFDEMTNSLLANAPYTGTMIATSMFAGPLTPLTIFAGGYMTGSSSIRQTALDNGFSEEEANLRGWVGGVPIGMIEAASGGASKYNPKTLFSKIALIPKKMTKATLREIFREEIPQQIIEDTFAADTPRNADGSLDWDEITNRYLVLARDTAAMSIFFTGAGSITGSALAYDAKRVANKQTSKAVSDAMNIVIAESEKQDGKIVPTPREIVEGEAEKQVVKEPDDIVIETTPDAVPIQTQVKNTTRYGVLSEGKDAKGKERYTVIDWQTQQEIKTGLGKRFAIDQATKLNTGEIEVPISRAREVLPTGQDIETLTHTQLLRAVFNAVSKSSRIVAKISAENQVKRGKNIAALAEERLDGLDITQAQRKSLIKKAVSARTPTQELQAMQAIETIREVSRKRKGVAEFGQIRSMVNKKSKLKLRDGGIDHKTAGVLQNLLNKYTSVGGKMLNAIKRAQNHIDSIREGVEGDFGADYAQSVMPKGLTSKFSEIMSTRIQDLSADQLEELNTTMQRYLRQAQLWGKLLQTRQARTLKNFLNNATDGVKLKEDPKAAAGEKIKRGKLKKIADFGTTKNDDIYTIATKIWGRFDPIGQLIRESRRKQLDLTLKYTGYLRGVISENNISIETLKSWSPFLHSTNLKVLKEAKGVPVLQTATEYTVNIGGTDRTFTMAEAMAFSMHVKNSYNFDKIVRNGTSTIRQRIGQMNKDEIKEVLQIVESEPSASAFVNALNVFYAGQAEDINKVSRDLDGINIATVDDYFHVEYETTGGVAGTQYVRDSMVDEEYINKFRVDSPHPVVIRDIFQVIGQDINVVSNFAGTTEAVRKLRSLANYKPFRKRMIDAASKHVLSEFDNRIRQFQQSRVEPASDFERGVNTLTTGVSRAILTSPLIWALQPTSAALYFTEASGKYARVLFTKLDSDTRKDIETKWILNAARIAGLGSAKSIATRSNIKKTFTGTGTAADIQLTVLHKADLVGVGNAGKITLAEMSDRNMSGVTQEWWQNYGVNPATLQYGTDEYWQAFNDRADYLVTLTQPMFFSENKSALTGSDNPLARAVFRFRSFIDQIGRILRRQTNMLRYGEISKAEYATNTGIAITLIAVITPLMRAVWDLIRGKEVEGEDIVRNMISAPLAVIPLAGYPLQRIAQALLGAEGNITPHVSAMPLMMADRILEHMWETARGINYMFDDEIIQSGPNRGKNKSDVFLRRGLGGIVSDTLMINGVPTRTIEQIEWLKED